MKSIKSGTGVALVLFAVTTCGATTSTAVEPLPARIDRLIAAGAQHPLNGPATDSEFLRRVFLDVIGRIPTTTEAREFLTNTDADKRSKLIEKLFGSPEFPVRLQELLHQMLMERRGDDPEWQRFLTWATETNQPWDKIASAILAPDADAEEKRGAAWFITKRLTKVGQQDTDYPGLTRDVGRLFAGVDLQCAQCHDHLFIEDYRQVDFQGLYTVYKNTAIRRDVKFPAVTESLMTQKIDYQSVFDMQPLQTGPRVPGRPEIAIPVFAKGEEYVVPPDRKKRITGVPKFSPLKNLANEMTAYEHRAFAGNLANRLWFTMMGRGLIHPLDQQHSGNPPSHPELYQLLTDEVLARKFDIKSFLKDLALTEVYQRSSRRSANIEMEEDHYQVAIEKPLWAEQLLWSTLTATGSGQKNFNPRKLPDIEDRRKVFLKAFANPPAEPEIEYTPSVQAALFVMNSDDLLELLKPADGNLVERLLKLSPTEFAEEAYLATLTRYPSAEEREEVLAFLEKLNHPEDGKSRSVRSIVWALLSSTEFCLNH